MKIALTGATGYLGGRLAPRLLEAGHAVRCLVRSPRKLEQRPWSAHPEVEIVPCDLGASDALRDSLRGCEVAYWMVHSMVSAGERYRERDRALARGFGQACKEAGVARILYLGGLGETGTGLSEHLSSRREVEAELGAHGVPVTVLRAAMIIGAGSASFEILRYLVERLPVMITPRWVSTESQPIAVTDVLRYLVQCLETPATIGQSLDVGGPDVLTYEELMQEMARARGLRQRVVIPVPVLTPRLSAGWIHWVTPIPHRLARPLAEGLRNRVVCRDERAREWMPGSLRSVREAIEDALRSTLQSEVETSWTDAGPMPGDPDWSGGDVRIDGWEVHVSADPLTTFRAICQVGGGHGWYAADALWRLRGWIDRLLGGPGLRRGRRHPTDIAYGDALDFWRVCEIDPPQVLRLRAEMRLPGEASLEFRLQPSTVVPGGTRVVQVARFLPKGLLGLVYWYGVLPLHGWVFRGMLNGIRREAQRGRAPEQRCMLRVRKLSVLAS